MAASHRRRIWVVVLVTAALVAVTVGILASAQPRQRDFVRVRSAAVTTIDGLTLEPSTTELTPTSNASTTSSVVPAVTTPATGAPSPYQVSATEGLTNLAPVTITATGIPSGGYLVGQCLAGHPVTLTTCSWNGDPQVAYPVDGVLTATVHVYWWVGNERDDCGSAAGVCVVGFESMNPQSGFAPVGFPISFDPARRPTITVTPSESLVDGQSVTVQGRDIGEGTVELQQCLLPAWASCVSFEVSSRSDGTFSTEMKARRAYEWGGHGPGSGVCGAYGDCVVEAWLTPKWNSATRIWINRDQPAALRFAPVPASSTTTSSTTDTTTSSTTTSTTGTTSTTTVRAN